MAVPVDPLRLAELVLQAGRWLHDVVSKGTKEQEQRAAVVLKEAGVLTLAIQHLENETQSVVRALSRFDDEWTRQERQELFDTVADFMGQRQTKPIIEQSLAELESHGQAGLDEALAGDLRVPLGELLQCGHALVELDYSSKMSFFVLGELGLFWDALRRAQSLEDVPWLAHWAIRVRQPSALDPLSRAAEAFGRIKAAILERHPGLPPPTWAL